MAKKAVTLPQDQLPLDNTGRLKTSWLAFFSRLQKTPATALTDLSGGATLAETITRVNALAEILRDNDLLNDS